MSKTLGLVFILSALIIPKLVFAFELAEPETTNQTLYDYPYSYYGGVTSFRPVYYYHGTAEKFDRQYGWIFPIETDSQVCGASFYPYWDRSWNPGLCGGYCYPSPDDRIDVYLVAVNTDLDFGGGASYFLGSVSSSDMSDYTTVVYPNFPITQKTVTSSFCYPVYGESATGTTYWIAFDAIQATSSFSFNIAVSRYGGSALERWMYEVSDPLLVYRDDTIYGRIFGLNDSGLTLDFIPEWVESNTSTYSGWFSQCSSIDLDFGWWTPLLRMFMYLFCPDIGTINQFTELQNSANDRVPFGYVNKLNDEVTNYATGSSEFILNFKINADLATATLNVTDQFLDVPEDVRNWFKDTIVWIAYIAFFIYFVFRGFYLFNKPSN